MNKHPINHVFQGLKYHNLASQVMPNLSDGNACYLCSSDRGNPCSLNPSDPSYNVSIKPCNRANDGADCLDCSEGTTPCTYYNSCLPGKGYR